MRLVLIGILTALSACAAKGAPRVDCRGPLRPVNAALLSGHALPPVQAAPAGGAAKAAP